MKKLKIIFAIAILSTVFTACTSADEPIDGALQTQLNLNNTNNTTTTSVVGTYKLTAFNTSVPTDLNGDGTTSTNQLSETTCFNNSLVTFNSNGTFVANNKGLEIDATVTPNILVCSTDPDSVGTYTVNGNILTTTYVENGVTYTDNVTISGNTLVSVTPNGSVVGMSAGNPVYLTSSITIIYTKQ